MMVHLSMINSIDEVIQHLDAYLASSKHGTQSEIDGKSPTSMSDEGASSTNSNVTARLFGRGRSRVIGAHRVNAIMNCDSITDLTFHIERQSKGKSTHLHHILDDRTDVDHCTN
jgi:hypothetical protein